MRNIFFVFIGIAYLFFQSGCNVTDHNVDPTRLPKVELNLMLPNALSQAAYNQQAFSARLVGQFMQYWTGFDSPITFDSYRLQPHMLNNIWNSGFYVGSLKDCQIIIEQAADEGRPHYEGIGKLIMAHELWQTTLMFGDIPYSQAFQGIENLNPAYDSQEDVMKSISQLLDESIALLQTETPLGAPTTDDLIFGGDTQAWLKTVWAMKARFHMHMIKRDPQAAQKVLDAIDQGAVCNLEEQANFKWNSNRLEAQPLARFATERPNVMLIDKRFAEKFLEDDPRREKYAFYDGFNWDYDHPSLHWVDPAAEVPLISYVEVCFMKAEALWHTQGAITEIQQALEAGIIASMEQVELTDADYAPYLAAMTPLTDLNREEQLEFIIVEAYKAYYGYANQITWANYRRTGYPDLVPHAFGSYDLNPEGEIPRRLIYPEEESIQNPDNVAAARKAQNGALMDVPLWIYQN
jgi:hypothetical protein